MAGAACENWDSDPDFALPSSVDKLSLRKHLISSGASATEDDDDALSSLDDNDEEERRLSSLTDDDDEDEGISSGASALFSASRRPRVSPPAGAVSAAPAVHVDDLQGELNPAAATHLAAPNSGLSLSIALSSPESGVAADDDEDDDDDDDESRPGEHSAQSTLRASSSIASLLSVAATQQQSLSTPGQMDALAVDLARTLQTRATAEQDDEEEEDSDLDAADVNFFDDIDLEPFLAKATPPSSSASRAARRDEHAHALGDILRARLSARISAAAAAAAAVAATSPPTSPASASLATSERLAAFRERDDERAPEHGLDLDDDYDDDEVFEDRSAIARRLSASRTSAREASTQGKRPLRSPATQPTRPQQPRTGRVSPATSRSASVTRLPNSPGRRQTLPVLPPPSGQLRRQRSALHLTSSVPGSSSSASHSSHESMLTDTLARPRSVAAHFAAPTQASAARSSTPTVAAPSRRPATSAAAHVHLGLERSASNRLTQPTLSSLAKARSARPPGSSILNPSSSSAPDARDRRPRRRGTTSTGSYGNGDELEHLPDLPVSVERERERPLRRLDAPPPTVGRSNPLRRTTGPSPAVQPKRRRAGDETAKPSFARRISSPRLIKSATGPPPSVVGAMSWDAVTSSWRGNDDAVSDFDDARSTASARPALISQLSSSTSPGATSAAALQKQQPRATAPPAGVKVVGNMAFDPVQLVWYSLDHDEAELDFDADFADDEAEGHGSTRPASGEDDHWTRGEQARLLKNRESFILTDDDGGNDDDDDFDDEVANAGDEAPQRGGSGAGRTKRERAFLRDCLERERHLRETLEPWSAHEPGFDASSRLALLQTLRQMRDPR